jgi:anti-sigma regulatory factor (Ser/Thr protein kinase)
VLNEALPNIIGYAYPDDGDHDIAIALEDRGDRVVIEITDDGVAFDPFEREPFVEAASLADAAIGGRGIHLMRSFTDAQEYRRRDGTNLIRLSICKPNSAREQQSARAG